MGLSEDALGRHAKNHLPAVLVPPPASPEPVAARPVAVVARQAAPLDPLDELTAALRERALAGNSADTREYRLALQAQATARHAAAPPLDFATEPEWIALRSAVLSALDPYPEARLAIADALAAL